MTALKLVPDEGSTAAISECGRYRHELTRRWSDGPTALWVMLNPSTADAERDDQTIWRCIGFSKREGMGRLVVVNCFAYRTSKPAELVDAIRRGIDIQAGNGMAVYNAFDRLEPTDLVIAAWGAHLRSTMLVEHEPMALSFAKVFGRAVHCLGRTRNGQPRHPARLPGDTPLEVYRP